MIILNNSFFKQMQPVFEDNAVSTIKVIIWLEQQIAIGKPFTLEYRDSSFEEFTDGEYIDHGIALINTLKVSNC